jgi:hypothetical protein
MYDRSIKLHDEPHPPEILERLIFEGALNKGKFLTEAHRDSYFQQMLLIRKLGIESVLEIGPGEGFIAQYMNSIGVKFATMDISRDSSPTILSRLEDFDPEPCKERWQMVCAFQMLEHSPYENFVSNLQKMRFMSSRYVFISLPYSCFGFSVTLNIGLGQSLRWKRRFDFYLPLFKRNRRYRREFMEEFPWAVHHWEIGRRGFPLARIRRDMGRAGLVLINEFRSENPYHYFILAERVQPQLLV